MPLTKVEAVLPWTGALAGVGFAVQWTLSTTAQHSGDDASAIYSDHLVRNTLAADGWAVTSIGLVAFAVALRAVLRSGEGEESTCSGVAHGGAVASGTAAAFVASTYWMLETAVRMEDHAAAAAINWVNYAGWIAVSICLVPLLWGVGLGGLRTRRLPRWFSVATIVLGAFALLGALHLPPFGVVDYVLLPVWLVIASAVVARRRTRPEVASQPVLETA